MGLYDFSQLMPSTPISKPYLLLSVFKPSIGKDDLIIMSAKDQRLLTYAKFRFVINNHGNNGIVLLEPTIDDEYLYLVFSTEKLHGNQRNQMPEDHNAWFGIKEFFYFTVLCDSSQIVRGDDEAYGNRIDLWCYEDEGPLQDAKTKGLQGFQKDVDTKYSRCCNIYNRILKNNEKELDDFLNGEVWELEKAVLATLK